MNHRSFRISKSPRPRLSLRLLVGFVSSIYLLLSLLVLAFSALVGSQMEFFRGDVPNWPLIIGFGIAVVIIFECVRAFLFSALKRSLVTLATGRILTSQQAEQYPGLGDPWPESWLRSGEKRDQSTESMLSVARESGNLQFPSMNQHHGPKL